jgi:uracil phosphoribosyltransferase
MAHSHQGIDFPTLSIVDHPLVRHKITLLRDRATGRPLYEARASNDGYSMGNAQLLAALFAAALKDFPATGLNPRTVVVPLAP